MSTPFKDAIEGTNIRTATHTTAIPGCVICAGLNTDEQNLQATLYGGLTYCKPHAKQLDLNDTRWLYRTNPTAETSKATH